MHLFHKTPPKDTVDEELLEEIERVKKQMENAHYNSKCNGSGFD